MAIAVISEDEVRELLPRLLEGLRSVLRDELTGLYLFGSAATGAYERGVSDVDLVAVVRDELTSEQLSDVEKLHDDIASSSPQWRDRIEVVYAPAGALRTFRTETFPGARVSPGEPFHAIDVDQTWLIDWYQLRRIGITLFGPPARTVVPEITNEEYVSAVAEHILDPAWRQPLESRGDLAYAVLSMCRGLQTVLTGDYGSKREAARWAARMMPEYAELIRFALGWRTGTGPNVAAAYRALTARLVADVQERVSQERERMRRETSS